MPAINHCVNTMGEEKNRRLLVGYFVFFCILPVVSISGFHSFRGHAAFLLNNGYSPLWLGYMYYVGAFIGKYDVKALLPFKIENYIKYNPLGKSKFLVALLLCMLVISYGIQVLYPRIAMLVPQIRYLQPATAGCYNSAFNVFIAITLLELFRRLRITHCSNILIFGSKYAFGVFLIHCQYHVYEYIGGRFNWISGFPLLAVPLVILCGFCIFIVCVGMDWIRDRLFKGLHCLSNLILLKSKS